jgi:predicted GIY-YIG superfamily endonuclease
MARSFCVYILASCSRNLYGGVTNNLERRLIEHREGKVKGFTTRLAFTVSFTSSSTKTSAMQ